MKINFLVIFLLSTIIVGAQKESLSDGVNWSEHLSWTEVKSRAASEHKYIFVDCFATWCGPCKAKDNNVYPLKSVADILSEKFICYKIQIDSIKNDNEIVRSHYPDSKYFQAVKSHSGDAQWPSLKTA
jgi:thiol:disulfide interchange protein